MKNVFLKISQNSQKAPVLGSLLNKDTDLSHATVSKRDPSTKCFSVNFANILTTSICRTSEIKYGN